MDVGTTQSQNAPGPEPQQATGQSIFWAFAAIVLNAMTQPSLSGYLWSGDMFVGSVWPHRSSPVICIVDGIAELWILVENHRSIASPNPEPREAPSVRAIDVATKLAVFGMAVLPQVIKVFTMKGIPGTQMVAAMFLVPSLISMVRGTCLGSPYRDISKLVARLNSTSRSSRLATALGWLIWILHGIGLFVIWYQISPVIKITTTEDVTNAFAWVSTTLTSLITIYISQQAFFSILGATSPIPRWPIVLLLFYTNNLGIADMVAPPEVRYKGGKNMKTFAAATLWNVSLCSYGLAYLLRKAAEALLMWTRTADIAAEAHPSEQVSSDRMLISDVPGDSHYTASVADVESALTVAPSSSSQVTPHAEVSSTVLSPLPDNNFTAMNTVNTTSDASEPRTSSDTSRTGPLPETLEAPQELSGTPPEALPTQNSNLEKPNTERPPTSTSSSDSSKWGVLVWIVLSPLLVIMILTDYAGIWDPDAYAEPSGLEGGSNDAETSHEPTAMEEGLAGQNGIQQITETSVAVGGRYLRYVLSILNRLLKRVVKCVLLSPWRTCMGIGSLWECTAEWLMKNVRSQPQDTVMVAFAILNFVTAVVYYLTIFDGAGTFTPSWTTILG